MIFAQVLIKHRVWYSDNVKRTHAIRYAYELLCQCGQLAILKPSTRLGQINIVSSIPVPSVLESDFFKWFEGKTSHQPSVWFVTDKVHSR